MPTLPPLDPERSTAGIAVDPRTLERVVPRTKRSDGSVRKELKIRPGFTPQEDIGRFKTSRQQAAEKNTLPKGHIVGWVAPSSQSKSKPQTGSGSSGGTKVPTTDANGQPLSKAALKNAKRKAKKIAEKANAGSASATGIDSEEEGDENVVAREKEDVPEAWDDEGDEEALAGARTTPPTDGSTSPSQKGRSTRADSGVDTVAEELGKLQVSK